jgi:hypothetical protein
MRRITGARRNRAAAANAGTILALLVLTCLGLAACGSSGSSTTNTTNTSASATTPGGQRAGATGAIPPQERQKIRRFAACIRANGFKLPEPNFSGGPVFRTKGSELNSEQFRAAAVKCQGYLRRSPGETGGGATGATG